MILDTLLVFFTVFQGLVEAIAIVIMNIFRIAFPSELHLPGTPFSLSLSFPNVPIFSEEKAVFPIDGTIFLTSEGYKPNPQIVTPMPNFNPNSPSNVQIFYNEYVTNSFADTVRKSELSLPILKFVIETLGLEEAFSYLPFAENLTEMNYGLYKDLPTKFAFKEDNLDGVLSPLFTMKDENGETAYSFAVTLKGNMDIFFEWQDDKTIVYGKINKIDSSDFIFFPGTITEIDVSDLTNRWNRFIIPIALRMINKILDIGFGIGTINILKHILNIEVDHPYIKAHPGYLELSFNMDISKGDTILA